MAPAPRYMLFCKKNRGKLKEEFPNLHFGKIGAKLGSGRDESSRTPLPPIHTCWNYTAATFATCEALLTPKLS